MRKEGGGGTDKVQWIQPGQPGKACMELLIWRKKRTDGERGTTAFWRSDFRLGDGKGPSTKVVSRRQPVEESLLTCNMQSCSAGIQ